MKLQGSTEMNIANFDEKGLYELTDAAIAARITELAARTAVMKQDSAFDPAAMLALQDHYDESVADRQALRQDRAALLKLASANRQS
jgi:hypothetical protein